jgi:hypothetical protein
MAVAEADPTAFVGLQVQVRGVLHAAKLAFNSISTEHLSDWGGDYSIYIGRQVRMDFRPSKTIADIAFIGIDRLVGVWFRGEGKVSVTSLAAIYSNTYLEDGIKDGARASQEFLTILTMQKETDPVFKKKGDYLHVRDTRKLSYLPMDITSFLILLMSVNSPVINDLYKSVSTKMDKTGFVELDKPDPRA